MYVINNMEFYVKISENDQVEYVPKKDATQYLTISEAAFEAEKMQIKGFSIEKY